ncbi:MAG: hypothetical protein HUK19_06475 [Fibrobacter sp.]|nr:hypothetical protein [Fibrobacter sp.]
MNKIGLSNTQRFYYLFKATANMLESKWPLPEVTLNKMTGFTAYTSALGYQGFKVAGAKDWILKDSMGTFSKLTQDVDMMMAVSEFRDASGNLVNDSSSAIFVSKQPDLSLAEGDYIWKFVANIENIADPSSYADTLNTYEVPFRIDTTRPIFDVLPELARMNPDSALFVAKFKWMDSTLKTPDIRAMRWTLERGSGSQANATFAHACDFRSLYEVSAPVFSVAWNDNCRAQVKNLGDGLYRVKAYAVDYAVPDSNAYAKMNTLVSAIAASPNYVQSSLWPTDAAFVNDTTVYALFMVDTHAPTLVLDNSKSVFTATADSLLKVVYTVQDRNSGLDSMPVTIAWDFVHASDTSKVDHAGDTVWVKNGSAYGEWMEYASMRLEDGAYILRARVRDVAGNEVVYKNLVNIRVDKTAPYIESIVSNALVSPDSATLKVNEKLDVRSNKLGVGCNFRVLGGDADTAWRTVPRDSANQYEKTFALPSSTIGKTHGMRYLEVACEDIAGNTSYRTDLFHVGERYPTITSPDSKENISADVVAITGMAPPSGGSDSEHAIYRLRYRNIDGLVPGHSDWQISQAYVTQALRSSDRPNVSRAAQVNEGVLGYIDRRTAEGEKIAGTYEIELSSCTADTASCLADSSLWLSDTMSVSFATVSHGSITGKPSVNFALRVKDALNPVSMTVGRDSLEVSLTLSGDFRNDYLIRLYAEGDDHVGIFEKSVSKVFRNPYYGLPADTAKAKGVWFYQDSLGYHLKWKGLPDGDTLKVSFASGKFGNTCESAAGGASLSSCIVRASAFNFANLPTVVQVYLEDFPEWIPPSYVDSVMMLAGDSGHVLMTAEAAFQVILARNYADTTKVKVPVYFASSAKDGFYWGNLSSIGSDTLDPLVLGWTANPQAYGLNFKWNGLMSADGYPSANNLKIFAEVTENVSENPFIYVDSAVVSLNKSPVEIVLDNKLPDYIVLQKDSSSINYDDSTQGKIDFKLGSMNVYYGIKNQDAHVGISIWRGSTLVAVLQDSTTLVRAKSADSAYQIKWDGKNANGNASLSEGTYKVRITATQLDGKKATPREATFRVMTAKNIYDMTPKDPKDTTGVVPAVYVAEAYLDSTGVFRYEPTADYRINARLHGYYLANSNLQDNGILLSGTVSGTQEIIGYEPKRFSLALKRHRKELDLVVLQRLHNKTTSIDCGYVWDFWEDIWHDGKCEHTHYDRDSIFFEIMTFNELTRSQLRQVHFSYSKNGFSGISDNSYLDIVACTRSTWERNISFKTKYEVSDFEKAKGVCEWTLKNAMGSNDYFKFPTPADKPSSGNVVTKTYPKSKVNVGCDTIMDGKYLKGSCMYGQDSTTDGYNPNKNLFEVSFISADSGRYFVNKTTVNDYDDSKYWTEIKYQLKLTIPDDYWDAPIGMDNLVNRTIRFDHANKTIFAKNASSSDGYLAAMDSLARVKNDVSLRWMNSYHDGSAFVFDKTYGLLTPFETQRLHFFPAGVFEGGLNMFLFADEDRMHAQDARFEMKFYGGESSQDYFVAKTIGLPASDESVVDCNYDTLTNVLLGMGGEKHCQIDHDSKTPNIKSTPYFSKNSNVEFFVGRNMLWSAEPHRDTIVYPAGANWRDTLKKGCKTVGQDWKFAENGSNPCYKYYDFGSRVHYYFADYVDSVWVKEILRTTNGSVSPDSIIANLANSPWEVYKDPLPFSFVRNVDSSRIGSNDVGSGLNVMLDPDMYDATEHRFFAPLDSVRLINSQLVGGGVNARIDSIWTTKYLSVISFSDDNDTLYAKASPYTKSVTYRKSEDLFAKPLVRPLYDTIPFSRLYTRPAWGREVVLDSARLVQLDGLEHTHFNLNATPKDSTALYVGFKSADSIPFHRINEFVELYAYLDTNKVYSLSYLNDSSFYSINDSIKSKIKGWRSLGWFNVNKLQGNTTFLLTWGDNSEASYNFSKFDMAIGARATTTGSTTVQSPLGELTVTFSKNSLNEEKNVTVRTIDAKNYPFEVFNNLALNGPIMEVLPSMTFENPAALPRVQMRISKEEMEALHTTPETIKLYKVDFNQKKFVPLEDALYGYLDADGRALLNNGFASDTVATCTSATDTRCYSSSKEWAYLLISAVTNSFSVFTVLDSAIAETPNFSIEVIPEVAEVEDRHVRVFGINHYNLYVDNDAVWADRSDSTPPELLPFTADTSGLALVKLPARGGALDTSYLFVVALSEPDSSGQSYELSSAPAVARAITVNTEFACHVPQDSLWLGLDNGYLAYAAGCTHPGYGIVSLYADEKVLVEFRGSIPDTLIYDGVRKAGGSGIGKIPAGIYESRYLGVSALGMNRQLAGPLVYTDSARPVIDSFMVVEESDVLDRMFRVKAILSDSESGIARVKVSPVLGGKELPTIESLPDSNGLVEIAVRVTRKQLTDCSGCRLTLTFRAEDYGHNHSTREYYSDALLPFPAELALWYPAYEGSGKIAHEYMQGHDLGLTNVKEPWGSDVGLYFKNTQDNAQGVGEVRDLKASSSYTFEARIKRGNAPGTKSILGFICTGGLDIRLFQAGKKLILSEGGNSWESDFILPEAKSGWTHIAVTVDSLEARFYVAGELASVVDISASPVSGLEREFDGGKFYMGKRDDVYSYIGNVADIRMYTTALTADQVYALSQSVTETDDEAHVIVIALNDMSASNGMEKEFSCSVAGNRFFTAIDSVASVSIPVNVEYTGEYGVLLYVRSAMKSSAEIALGENGSLRLGTVALSPVWRPVYVTGLRLELTNGLRNLTLRIPEGVQLGGFALSTTDVSPSSIAWGTTTGVPTVAAAPAKVKTYLLYEGFPETSTLRPRMRLVNVSDKRIDGFSIRYYFRGEDPAQARVQAYYPWNDSVSLSIHAESFNTGYAEWKFPDSSIAVGASPFNAQGPHFGIFNHDYTWWNAYDDPSYEGVNGAPVDASGFYENAGIVVLDNDMNLIGGSCVEMEDGISPKPGARAIAKVARDDVQATEVYVKLENTGNMPLNKVDIRYYFRMNDGIAPVLETNDSYRWVSLALESMGDGHWYVNVHADSSTNTGVTWDRPAHFTLHARQWENVWDGSDDPSRVGLGVEFAEASGICVYDAEGNLLYGNEPKWQEPEDGEGGVPVDSMPVVDYGYQAPNIPAVPIVRTEDGLLVSYDGYAYVELDLVSALGVPVSHVYRGNITPGEQLIRFEWTGIDMKNTFLVFRINSAIMSTKRLSLL